MDRRHLMYSVWKHIKDWTLVFMLSISCVVPSEAVFVHVHALLHLISSLYLYILSSGSLLLKWTRVLPCRRPQGRFWLSLEWNKGSVRKTKQAIQGNYNLWMFTHPCRYLHESPAINCSRVPTECVWLTRIPIFDKETSWLCLLCSGW